MELGRRVRDQYIDISRHCPSPGILTLRVLECEFGASAGGDLRRAVDGKATVGDSDSCCVVLEIRDIVPIERLRLVRFR